MNSQPPFVLYMDDFVDAAQIKIDDFILPYYIWRKSWIQHRSKLKTSFFLITYVLICGYISAKNRLHLLYYIWKISGYSSDQNRRLYIASLHMDKILDTAQIKIDDFNLHHYIGMNLWILLISK